MSQWVRHRLPERIEGLTFLDVGCWEGELCVEAASRGADCVVGVDYCTSPDLIGRLSGGGFSFIQLDILSEKALELPEFDIVHCAGVLYHVENPLSLLFRLRKLCRPGAHLYLETTFYASADPQPVMVFHPDDSLDENVSNWWSPSRACLAEMLRAAGFADVETTYLAEPGAGGIGRICVRAVSAATPQAIPLKLLPRRPSFMPQAAGAGNRVGVTR